MYLVRYCRHKTDLWNYCYERFKRKETAEIALRNVADFLRKTNIRDQRGECEIQEYIERRWITIKGIYNIKGII